MVDFYETPSYVFVHVWILSIPERNGSVSYRGDWREAAPEEWRDARWINGIDVAQSCAEDKTIPSTTPISVSELARRISDLVGEKPMAKLKYSVITEFLIDNGFLIQSIDKDGKKKKTPTELGKSIGISTEKRIGSNGQYDVTLYSSMAQQFIIDNLYAILNDKK